MEEKKDFTMMFKKEKKPEILSKEETIKQVVKALEEKKYNVSHNNARNLITTYDREDLLEEIVSFYLKKK